MVEITKNDANLKCTEIETKHNSERKSIIKQGKQFSITITFQFHCDFFLGFEGQGLNFKIKWCLSLKVGD